MNDPKSQQEPSMEEILASIRRIISEDDTESEEGQDAAPEGESDDAPVVAVEEAAVEEAAVDEPADDVLELTDEVDDESDDYDMALTDDSEIVEVMDADEEPAPAPVADEAAPAPAAPAPDGGLISPPQDGQATSQFAVLAAAVAGDRIDTTMGVGARTIEDLVKEVMRPIIKEWLDAHLPALVERLVGREIDRMARRAEDGIDD